ncbi:GNAT family N-acetyltransferase [Streptomyces bambusae]|uniref:GNAT family N-acetyltransferase n=1 Tax=Streptomyces bambusae TaxID=1550616 RepID=UPI001CFFCFF0|nr:GNAT family N-acetyltransferase [Streptomyces bambusae]MCB5169781.1 GNAT family N-acetyltransferase [Streptomyces bambusae]
MSFTIGTARSEDAEDVAEVWLRSYDAALPGVRRAHTDDEVRGWFSYVIVPAGRTWIARDADGAAAGMMVLEDGVIEQLYLAPERRGQGLGDRFVDLAKELSPAGLELWTFQVNAPAHRFYERHGFAAAERTDGATNEEREPDVRYVWKP